MAEDFPNLKMEKHIQVHEAQITNKKNSNSPTPRHIIIKVAKKKRILNAGGKKKKAKT